MSGESYKTWSVIAHCAFGVTVEQVSTLIQKIGDEQAKGDWSVREDGGVIVVSCSQLALGKHGETQAVMDALRQEFGAFVYGDDPDGLPAALVAQLSHDGLTITTAESCTGGLIGSLLTGVSGASDVYPGGWVTYANRMKHELLGVEVATLQEHGAVSSQVAVAMAEGALKRGHADIGISVTGLAGPGGGSPDKPVGTVWFGFACGAGIIDPSAMSFRCRFDGGRGRVRRLAALTAIQAVRLLLLGEQVDSICWVDAVVE